MVALDRIRLTGLLRESPAPAGLPLSTCRSARPRDRGERLPARAGDASTRSAARRPASRRSQRRRVPVERRPLEPPVAALDRDPREVPKQRPADAAAPALRQHEQVLQPHPGQALPGGEGPCRTARSRPARLPTLGDHRFGHRAPDRTGPREASPRRPVDLAPAPARTRRARRSARIAAARRPARPAGSTTALARTGCGRIDSLRRAAWISRLRILPVGPFGQLVDEPDLPRVLVRRDLLLDELPQLLGVSSYPVLERDRCRDLLAVLASGSPSTAASRTAGCS